MAERTRERSNAFYWFVKALFWPAGRFYFRMEVLGRVPPSGPLILAANHSSFLDPPALGSACPRPVRFVITRRVHDKRGQRWFYERMRSIPVVDDGSPDHGAMRTCLRALSNGEVVGIFPEGGGFDPHGKIRSAREGVALLAMRAGVPLVPVAIEGTHRALPLGGIFPRPVKIRVTFGEPFVPRDGGPDGTRLSRRELADEMMTRISDLMRRSGRR